MSQTHGLLEALRERQTLYIQRKPIKFNNRVDFVQMVTSYSLIITES